MNKSSEMNSSISPLIKLSNIEKTFVQGNESLSILKGISCDIYQGEIIGLIGESGTGKSTLLNIIGLLNQASAGHLYLNQINVTHYSEKECAKLRSKMIGFIYQKHYLFKDFTALENVEIPFLIKGRFKKDATRLAKELLDKVEMSHRLNHYPVDLSSGEQQRVAIARALGNEPKILLADEPTGNLDEKNASKVFDLFIDLVKNEGVTALIVTHNKQLALKMDRLLHLNNGHFINTDPNFLSHSK